MLHKDRHRQHRLFGVVTIVYFVGHTTAAAAAAAAAAASVSNDHCNGHHDALPH